MWVSPFGDLRVNGYVLLTVAFRSLSRPSSAPSARASTLRSFCLTALTYPSSVRASGFSMVLSIFLHNIKCYFDVFLSNALFFRINRFFSVFGFYGAYTRVFRLNKL